MRNLFFILFILLGFSALGQVEDMAISVVEKQYYNLLQTENNAIYLDTFDIPKQEDSLVLPEVLVLGYHRRSVCSTEGFIVEEIDSYRKELVSLSETLNKFSFISLKNYGAGSLSTISLRGHSASQTNISLDGFNIQSNMNGVYDLSLIPSFFWESVSILGSSSSAEINGNIGGNLDIDTKDYLYGNRTLKLEYISSFGSYNDIGNYLSINGKWGKKRKHNSSFKTFYRSSKNDFPYQDLNQIGTPTKNLDNSAFQQLGFQQNNRFHLRDSSFIATKFWYVDNHREIPPTLTQNTSEAFQDDQLLHGIISWDKDWSKKINTILSTRYMNEHIYFEQPGIEADSRAQKAEIRSKVNYQLNSKNSFSTTIGHEYSQAKVDDYETLTPSENRTYALASYAYKTEQFLAGIRLREEIIEGDLSPFLFSAYGKYIYEKDDDHLSVSGNISKNYRRPTFNDLYWRNSSTVGGNPNLAPENGWKEDLNIHYYNNNYRHSYSLGLTLFNSNINNWILWSPDDTGKWTPENVKEVWSRGIEFEFETYLRINSKLKIDFNSRYNFVKTTNTKVLHNTENTLGKQLIYVPLHSGSFNFDIRYQQFKFTYQQMISGKRFNTTDNSSFVSKYTVSNIQLSYLFKKKKIEIEPVFEIRNVWNQKYQIVLNRPLPPIHFQGSIYFRFNQ